MTTTTRPAHHALSCTCVPCLIDVPGDIPAHFPRRDEDLTGRASSATTVCGICLGPIRVSTMAERRSLGSPALSPTARGWEHARCHGATETAYRMMVAAGSATAGR